METKIEMSCIVIDIFTLSYNKKNNNNIRNDKMRISRFKWGQYGHFKK